jgi:4-alpha-glucanotransferase
MTPLFPPGYRAAGVLLHVTSLPSRYGIGDLGPAAFEWIDRLCEAGQS